MRRLRRFALAAVVLDALLGIGVVLVSGEAAGAREAPLREAPPPAAVRFVPTEAGCAALHATAPGAWRYEGLTDAASCEAER